MKTINELIQEVHANAVEHGWWDTERDIQETVALIHSEWSEALEEARAGRPMRWKSCNSIYRPVCQDSCPWKNKNPETDCIYTTKKPEGIAVELIDGCIRIMDLLGSLGKTVRRIGEAESVITIGDMIRGGADCHIELPALVCQLHVLTSMYVMYNYDSDHLISAMTAVFLWIHNKGYDPESLLLEKHEYNKTRPYKHGKKF